MFKDKTRLYISAAEIQKTCERLGAEITKSYTGKNLVLIAVLKGSVIFFADLIRQIHLPVEIDFVRLSSYGMETQSSGQVKIIHDVSVDLKDKDVLVIEDIIDTGLTLHFFTGYLKKFQPRSVKLCALLDKPSRRRVQMDADFCGIKIEDHFVVGYGLDYQELCRNYADIYQVIN